MSSGSCVPYNSFANDQIKIVGSFEELVSTPLCGSVNALCWPRSLTGDFREVASALRPAEPVHNLSEEDLRSLQLSAGGRAAVEEMLRDFKALRERDLLPELNCLQAYPREDSPGLVPLDVYSFHADSATAQADTYLCTYFGPASEGVRNDEVFRYTDRPEIRAALLAEFGAEDGDEFREFLRETGYDLHYQALPGARPFSFGLGNLWRLATDYPGNPVPPCIHRAPTTAAGDPPRLLLIS